MNPDELILVSNLIIPPKFKTSLFEKYEGTTCLEAHLVVYYCKMARPTYNEKLLIHVFQNSLMGGSTQMYLKLRRNQIRIWKDLARAFLEQFKYMLETTLDRFTLQSMEKKLGEIYREYAIRWKTVASQVWPALTNKETNSLFVDTLPFPYYDMLIGNAFHEVGDLLYSMGRIEDGVKKGRILNIGEKNA